MIDAWVLYYDGVDLYFKELVGESFTETDPTKWGLPADYQVVMVFQKAQFLQAWIKGKEVRR